MTTGTPLETIDFEAAAARLDGVVRRTRLLPFPVEDERVELRLKLECEQETGAFKARGAWNNISCLTEAERRAGVVATSSGNHGKALAWAAQRAGVKATIFMPANSYANKIQACRDHGAEVVLTETRQEAEAACAARVAAGAVLVHPYDARGTVEGAGTTGLEIAQDWPEVEVVVLPVGGGGLLAGSSLAIRRTLGGAVRVFGVEPAGSPNMTLGLEAGGPVDVDPITTKVQGLCPLQAGRLNVQIALECVDGVFTLEDDEIYAGQRALVRAGHTVEPAGAATFAWVRGGLPVELLSGRSAADPLRVAAVISGGNADPAQLEELRR